ncbi:MAG: 50S ribosomal protein L29 [Candidatus Nealsonbacteria bacterium]|nr:50S ribosomal protein L29 [Candidatus Nealsonbacteria bacterium]
MKTKEIRQKNTPELQKLLHEKKGKLGNLNFDLVGGKVKNVKEIRETRKDIAKILTILQEGETVVQKTEKPE